jgi:UDP-GlcNAc:undecaprenyl-phosphate GlcNAc-1-phosphate transferase
MTKYLFFVLVPTALSLGLTPLVRLLAIRIHVLDFPSERKIHKKPIPLLGGIAVFLAFNGTLLFWQLVSGENAYSLLSDRWYALPICQVIILGVGIYDDVKRLQPKTKFFAQILVGLLMVLFGFGIENLANPLSGKVLHLGAWAIPLTIIWVVGITNALNLVDGLDGLAAGTALIASTAIFAISYLTQNMGVTFLALALAGAVLGFLRYNFFPARIFLGDSGSLLLGFVLAVLSIKGATKGATLVAVLAPILPLGLPIMDTLLSMLRRILNSLRLMELGKSGKVRIFFSMFEADKEHVHHRLLKMGYSHTNAVLILYMSCAVLCVLAFLTVALRNLNVVALLVAILIVVSVGIKNLHYKEFKILESGLLLPLLQFPVINKTAFLAFFDLGAIILSYSLSYLICHNSYGAPDKSLFLSTLGFVLLFKMGIFYLSRFYKGSWIHSQLEDLLAILKVIVFCSLGATVGLSLLFGAKTFGGIFFILDFYFLMTFVISFRISYRVIYSTYNRAAPQTEKRVLIYGAGKRASTVIQEIRRSYSYAFAPIGFIDDNPKKVGRLAYGCPVLGSIDDLDGILTKHSVLEIIISTDKIGRDKIGKLLDFCKRKGIILRQFEFRFYEFP